MCKACYKRYGNPRVMTPRARSAASLIGAADWASLELHLQIDDWNLGDEFFSEDAAPKNEVSRRCFDALKECSVDERATALAIASGYISGFSASGLTAAHQTL